jgi:hypothetical protein
MSLYFVRIFLNKWHIEFFSVVENLYQLHIPWLKLLYSLYSLCSVDHPLHGRPIPVASEEHCVSATLTSTHHSYVLHRQHQKALI